MVASCWNRSAMARLCILAVVCCLLLAGGCASRQGGDGGQGLSMSVPEQDTSPPLTASETAALNTTGQVDKNIPDSAMPDVTRQYKYFLRKGRPAMSASSKRAEQFLAYAKRVFRSRGMPEDLAYLAIVESGYRSEVRSPAGAAGAWQFMPYTGQKYGLNQDWWTDERLDPFKSTEAAADYLQKLYGDFGDWPTAIAAYNAGEGKLGRAKQGTGGRDFFEIKSRNHMLDDKAQLRDETKQYVPRYLAVTKIMRNLSQLGFDPIHPDSAPGVVRLTAKPGTDLAGMARACRMDWETFAAFNRQHKRPITDTGRPTYLYVPASREHDARAYLASPQCATYAGWGPCSVASSADSWEKISRRSGVPVGTLRAVNPGNPTLKAGETVLVPRSVNMSAQAVAALDAKPAKGADKADKSGKAGKTGKVAAEREPQAVEPHVPGARVVAANDGPRHTLRADETLSSVAKKYGVSVQDLQQQNGIADQHKVHAGMVLRIPAKAGGATASAAGRTAPAASAATPAGPDGRLGGKTDKDKTAKAPKAGKTYTVQANDTLWKIARTYNVSVDDLKRWNGVDEKNLRTGARLVVEQ
ncbi:LysM peptidoglycan-binding domain-containing protein [Desulfovibrio desulfuricans]|uniref:LysM peptidoglycan-binding domain-containing protein n=2 Tax=Desulfovibrio desulfuricans TaxID=876 RepID=A0A4P7UIS0_DESDE|nr:LysM peptidoglycan-binding domain-containing protein [Desulfovibrio desulfuricans]